MLGAAASTWPDSASATRAGWLPENRAAFTVNSAASAPDMDHPPRPCGRATGSSKKTSTAGPYQNSAKWASRMRGLRVSIAMSFAWPSDPGAPGAGRTGRRTRLPASSAMAPPARRRAVLFA